MFFLYVLDVNRAVNIVVLCCDVMLTKNKQQDYQKLNVLVDAVKCACVKLCVLCVQFL